MKPRKTLLGVLCVLVLFLDTAGQSNRGLKRTLPPLTEQQVARRALAAIVSVSAHINAAELSRTQTGTGFFFEGNFVMTCEHVVANASELTLMPVIGGRIHAAKLVYSDHSRDIAVLQPTDSFVLPHLSIAVASPAIGERIYVVSNPKGFMGSFTSGNVSAYREAADADSWMQISAAVSPGSSGGAVLNSRGQVVGVVSASRQDAQNLNFAVPLTANSVALITLSALLDDPFGLLNGPPAKREPARVDLTEIVTAPDGLRRLVQVLAESGISRAKRAIALDPKLASVDLVDIVTDPDGFRRLVAVLENAGIRRTRFRPAVEDLHTKLGYWNVNLTEVVTKADGGLSALVAALVAVGFQQKR
jgi:S1-C subfamily serine protease